MGNKKKFTIGMDIGGTKILTCLLNKDFEIRSEFKLKTRPDKGEGFFLKNLSEAVTAVLRDGKVDREEVMGIGVGCPGFIDTEDGVILGSPNIPFQKWRLNDIRG